MLNVAVTLCLTFCLYPSITARNTYDYDVIEMSQQNGVWQDYNDDIGAPKPFSFARYYGNNMVLQRAPNHAIVWGYSPNIGERIMVKMSETEKIYKSEVVMGPDGVSGVWKVKLDPESRPGPFVISVYSSKTIISINNVLFGDVWLCSGQSNMQFTVSQTFNASELINEASKYNEIRLFTVNQVQSNTPEYDLIEVEETWSLPGKDTVGGDAWKYFSSVCWLFGRNVYEKRQYPIGLIGTDWGGTPVECWSSADALSKCNLMDEYFSEEANYREDVPSANSVLWNSMIHPFLNMTIYGAIWYQGEANEVKNVDLYNCTFPSMIADWRSKFSEASDTNPMFPFGFVQLAPNRLDPSVTTGFPDIRWHQTADYGHVPNEKMPNVFMSVAMDLPDFFSPFGSIHPRDKQDVAKRLLLSGLAVAYNETVDEWQGPLPNKVTIQPTGIILYFPVQITTRTVEGFEICCSADGGQECIPTKSWWLSTPIISKTESNITLYSICGEGQNVLGIRYAWRETPCQFKTCAVYSMKANLPAPPFIWYKPTNFEQNERTYPLLWNEPQHYNF